MRKRKCPAKLQPSPGHEPEKDSRENEKEYTPKRKSCQAKRRNVRMLEKPGYWSVIPAAVRYDRELPPNAKLLYAEISSLTDATGYCFASNLYFEQLYELSERTVIRLLNALKSRGYIRIEDNGGGKSQRKIFAGINPAAGAPVPTLTKMSVPPDKNVSTPLTKMSPPTSITRNINNKSNKTPQTPQGEERGSKCKAVWKPERFEKFWEFYPRMSDGSKPAKARAARAWDKLKPDDDCIRKMATALQRQKESELWKRGIGVPYASSWLNARRWEDEWAEPEEEDGDAEDEVVSREDLPEW